MGNEIKIPSIYPSQAFSGPRAAGGGGGGIFGGGVSNSFQREWSDFLLGFETLMANYEFNVASNQLYLIDALRVGSDATYIDIDGNAIRIRSSNYVPGINGSGFTLESGLLEVGNIACRGIFRTAVFQKDVISVVGGNLMVLPGDVLAADMVASDTDVGSNLAPTSTCTDPDDDQDVTTGWTPTSVDLTIDSIAGGNTGNCLEITRVSGITQAARSGSLAATVGKIYRLDVYVKSGTSGNETFVIYIRNEADSVTVGSFLGTSSAAWVKYTVIAESPYAALSIRLTKDSSTAGTMLFDDITLYEITTLTIEGNETFSVGDLLRIKDGADDEWMEVLLATSEPVYAIDRDKGTDYSPDDNPVWTKGATVVSYGPNSGAGAIHMTASEANAPYLQIFTHAGSPWDTLTPRVHIGNMNGVYGYSNDYYGIGIGDSTLSGNYLKYDSNSGTLTITGNITITGGSTNLDSIANGSTYGRVNLTAISAGNITLVSCVGDLDDVSNGSSYGRVNLTAISGGKIVLTGNGVTGSLSVTYTDADVTANENQNLSWLNGASGTLTISSTGSIAINAANALEIQAAGNILVKQGGDIVMEGGGSGNPSLIRFKDEAVSGELRFEQSGNSSNYWSIKKTSAGDSLKIDPVGGLTSPNLELGTNQNACGDVDVWSTTGFEVYLANTIYFRVNTSGVFLPNTGLHIGGTSNPGNDNLLVDGNMVAPNMPGANPGAGILWNDGGTIKMGT